MYNGILLCLHVKFGYPLCLSKIENESELRTTPTGTSHHTTYKPSRSENWVTKIGSNWPIFNEWVVPSIK